MSELLPCPFCGSKPERTANPLYGDQSMVRCRQCGAELFDRKWNKRASAFEVLTEDARGFLYAILGADTWLEAGAVWESNPAQRKAARAALSGSKE